MIHPFVKIMVVDHFLQEDEGIQLKDIANSLRFVPCEFGEYIEHFNMVSEDADEMFSKVLNTKIKIDKDRSGVFIKPVTWIHFEYFDNLNEWLFVVALSETTLNIFEHQSGAVTALDGHEFSYRNLFEWDLQLNFVLKPGQGILFRPWLFHSFNGGLIQQFRLKEEE